MNSYLSFLSNIVANNFSHHEINTVVEKTYVIALSYIQSNYKKFRQSYLNDESIYKELAIDSITPLFNKNNEGEFYVLNKIHKEWISRARTESEAFYFLYRMVANRVEQQFIVFLSEVNPFFKKILESVSYYATKEGYSRINHLGTVYIVKGKLIPGDKKILETEDFELLPNSLFVNMKLLLPNLFHFIINETEYFPAVPLNALVNKLMHMNLTDINKINTAEDLFYELEVNNYIKLGLERTIKKLECTYYASGKLNHSEFEGLKKALNDMAGDLKDGGINRGMYSYLSPYFKNLNKAEFNIRYRHIVEYMIKILKKSICENF